MSTLPQQIFLLQRQIEALQNDLDVVSIPVIKQILEQILNTEVEVLQTARNTEVDVDHLTGLVLEFMKNGSAIEQQILNVETQILSRLTPNQAVAFTATITEP